MTGVTTGFCAQNCGHLKRVWMRIELPTLKMDLSGYANLLEKQLGYIWRRLAFSLFVT
ncbi:hypothetical protein Pcar_3217 [Syntrophotalea carbinolica DSM 2380]|uniref:Uncharacterized protein n=1 Tax=Syntrophotalea carbinolica (strain DSM 2380 / NBRC 103641 / GraBd1) TaxID=338963 RepID=Q0C6V0_SYNC1|nr:hypothetical protein Pcar_3217 [Syntrophotalea carbinolica DSM 2380]